MGCYQCRVILFINIYIVDVVIASIVISIVYNIIYIIITYDISRNINIHINIVVIFIGCCLRIDIKFRLLNINMLYILLLYFCFSILH
jgi:hypothetical protein